MQVNHGWSALSSLNSDGLDQMMTQTEEPGIIYFQAFFFFVLLILASSLELQPLLPEGG